MAWTDDDEFDEATYRSDVTRYGEAGMPGVYTGGTTGGSYAIFGHKAFTDSTVDRLGGLASGFLKTSLRCRGSYSRLTAEDVEILHRWYCEHFPEMVID